MKMNFISIVIFLFYGSVVVQGQATDHMKFMAVPIDGQVSDFTNKLKNIGLVHLFGNNGFTQMRGDFAGYRTCYVMIPNLHPNDVAYKVIVFFPALDNWQELTENYFEIKSLLTEKYGEPSEVSETFEVLGISALDYRSPLYKVKTDRCFYNARWITKVGDIHLSITQKDGKSCMVRLVYLDKINSEARKNRIIGDL